MEKTDVYKRQGRNFTIVLKQAEGAADPFDPLQELLKENEE